MSKTGPSPSPAAPATFPDDKAAEAALAALAARQDPATIAETDAADYRQIGNTRPGASRDF